MPISTIKRSELPPGDPGIPYVTPFLSGEIIFIPCSNSATRLVVTGKETNNAFAIVGSGGTAGMPIGFHFHKEAHDIFLCLKGSVNVWAEKKCRTMSPGDFASVPPGTIHQYQIIGDYTEFIGLIVPGGWEEFFRFIGESYSGPLFPLSDDRNVFEVLMPKLKAAAEKFDMIPQPHHPPFDPQPWESDDNSLPNGLEPYFLKNGSGPKFMVSGTLCRPLATPTQSAGRFSVASIEGSSYHKTSLLGEGHTISFKDTHHCFQISEGSMKFEVDGAQAHLATGETLFVPSGSKFKFWYVSRFAKAYVFSNGGGLVEIMTKLGEHYEPPLIPEDAPCFDRSKLSDIQAAVGFTFH